MKPLCVVLMPFDENFTPVYESAIGPAVEAHLGINSAWRADQSYWKEKMDEVRQNIHLATLIIIDVSKARPAVMWEHGFCDALHKTMIVISSEPASSLPFNIRSEDFIQYENNTKGLPILKKKLEAALDRVLPVAHKIQHSCLNSFPWRKSYQVITETLASIDSSSFRAELVDRELKRLTNQMAGLQNGLYTLRKNRPMEEIVGCYCDLLEKMRDADEKEGQTEQFDTVTCIDFWRVFTEDGRDGRYLAANIDAAMRGVKIRRVFLLDARRRGQNSTEGKALQKILRDLLTACEKWPSQISLKIHESKTYDVDITNVYTNFAILKNGGEMLLLQPQYTSIDDERLMDKTEFVWSGASPEIGTNENLDRIKRYSSKFDELWKRSEDLTTVFLDEYFTTGASTEEPSNGEMPD